MLPRTVQLSDEAYATLANLKRPNESFSDTVKWLAAAQKNPEKLLQLSRWTLPVRPEETAQRMAMADRARFRELDSCRQAKRRPRRT
ncbi:MAG: antitoxin VapB family protein [Thermoplasmatota archaeon]